MNAPRKGRGKVPQGELFIIPLITGLRFSPEHLVRRLEAGVSKHTIGSVVPSCSEIITESPPGRIHHKRFLRSSGSSQASHYIAIIRPKFKAASNSPKILLCTGEEEQITAQHLCYPLGSLGTAGHSGLVLPLHCGQGHQIWMPTTKRSGKAQLGLRISIPTRADPQPHGTAEEVRTGTGDLPVSPPLSVLPILFFNFSQQEGNGFATASCPSAPSAEC